MKRTVEASKIVPSLTCLNKRWLVETSWGQGLDSGFLSLQANTHDNYRDKDNENQQLEYDNDDDTDNKHDMHYDNDNGNVRMYYMHQT